MRALSTLIPILLITFLVTAMGVGEPARPEFTADFDLDHCSASLSCQPVPYGFNKFFSLKPGTFHRYEGKVDGEYMVVERTVLDETRTISFQLEGRWMTVVTRVVEEREWIGGALSEVALNYYARCPQSGNIFYFGEDVEIYDHGRVVSHDGSWLAGKDGALPGLYMPGTFLLGARYYQELAPGVAMDRTEHLAMGIEIETPAGVFTGGVMMLDTDPYDPDEETIKIYAQGVGLIKDGTLELVEYHR